MGLPFRSPAFSEKPGFYAVLLYGRPTVAQAACLSVRSTRLSKFSRRARGRPAGWTHSIATQFPMQFRLRANHASFDLR
jgi:hypothetical protein